MKLRLDLSTHCIETALKRRREAATSRYFKDGDGRHAADAELVLLEAAFSAFDFSALRSRWPALSGGAQSVVFLTRNADDRPCLIVDGRCIVPPADEETAA